MALFTFILDYAGGTYVSQHRARSWKSAPAAWARGFDAGVIPGISGKARRAFGDGLSDIAPIAVDGLAGVWCVSFRAGREIGLLHYVRSAG